MARAASSCAALEAITNWFATDSASRRARSASKAATVIWNTSPLLAPHVDGPAQVVGQERVDLLVRGQPRIALRAGQRPGPRRRIGLQTGRADHAAQERGAVHLLAHHLGLLVAAHTTAHHPAERPGERLRLLQHQGDLADVDGLEQERGGHAHQHGRDPGQEQQPPAAQQHARQLAQIQGGGLRCQGHQLLFRLEVVGDHDDVGEVARDREELRQRGPGGAPGAATGDEDHVAGADHERLARAAGQLVLEVHAEDRRAGVLRAHDAHVPQVALRSEPARRGQHHPQVLTRTDRVEARPGHLAQHADHVASGRGPRGARIPPGPRRHPPA